MDEAAKKTALRSVPYGLYIGGAAHEGQMHAFLLSWLSQCSFEPPLVMCGVKADGHAHDMILASGKLSVNLLAPDQKPLAADFLKTAVHKDGQLSGHAYQKGKATGTPILDEAPAWLELEVRHVFKGGDHTVVVAEVMDAGVRPDTFEECLGHRHTGWHYAG